MHIWHNSKDSRPGEPSGILPINKAENLTIIHRDEFLVVVDKPGGLLSVPGRGPDKSDCVVNRLKYMIPGCMEQPSVHRLDMDTSGLLVLALRPDAHRNLSRQFQEREVEKRYIALLDGSVTGNGGEIQLSFRLDVDNRPYQVYDPVHGKLGVTLWSKIAEDDHTTRIAFTPITGRTHQLRVHAAHPLGLDCPIIGDRLYGNGIPGDSLLLHAHFLRFRHPVSGVIMNFESNVPF